MSPLSPFRTMLAAALSGALFASALSASVPQTSLEPALAASAVEDELLQMASRAGVIFVGEVLSVTSRPSFTPGSGTVEIAFRVDQPILGCDGQATYTLREWAGLWTGGHQRYTPGQRLLILLHTPSASGLSSPVGGQDGMIPVIGTGIAPKFNDTTVAQAEPTVDLRWVQARVPRAVIALQNTRLHSMIAPLVSGEHEHGPPTTRQTIGTGVLRSSSPTPSLAESTNTFPLSPGTTGISLRSILNILGAWQARQSHASR